MKMNTCFYDMTDDEYFNWSLPSCAIFGYEI